MKTRIFSIVVVLTLALFIGAVAMAAPKSSAPKSGVGTATPATTGTGSKIIDKTKTAPFIPTIPGKEDEMDSIEECPSVTGLRVSPSEDSGGVITSWPSDWEPHVYSNSLTAEVFNTKIYETSGNGDDVADAGEEIFCLYKITGTEDPTEFAHVSIRKTVADGWQCTVRDESSFNCEEI